MKIYFTFSFYLFFLFSGYSQAALETQLDAILNNEENLAKQSALKAFIKTHDENHVEALGRAYHELGKTHYISGDFENAIATTFRAIEIREAYKSDAPEDYYRSMNNVRVFYSILGKKKEELDILLQMFNGPKSNLFYPVSGVELSFYYASKGDYFKALRYSDEVIDTYSIHKDETQLIKAHLAKIYALVYLEDNELARNNNILHHKNEIEKRVPELTDMDKVDFYSNMGFYYDTDKKFEKALNYYEKAESHLTQDVPSEFNTIVYLNLGKTHSELENGKKAQHYYNKVIESGDSIRISSVYNNLGYFHAQSLDKEIDYHKKAIEFLDIESNLKDREYFSLEIKESPHKMKLLLILIDLSQAWLKKYNKTNSEAYLYEALQTLYIIDDIISILRIDSSVKLSKLFWISKGVNSYLSAVHVCFLLDNVQEAFYFMEKNKSLYLSEGLAAIELREKYEIPDSILQKEHTLNHLALKAQRQLKSSPEDIKLQKEFTDASQNRDFYTDSLKSAFPDFFNTKWIPEIISLPNFQNILFQKEMAAVEYILGADQGFGLYIDGSTTHFFELKDYDSFIVNIVRLKAMFVKPSFSNEDVRKYLEIGPIVFNTLFPWDSAMQDISNVGLKIIPDGELYNFSFESLPVGNVSTLKENYLIQKADISFLNSASVFQNLSKLKKETDETYLGIAPIDFKQRGLPDLQNSKKMMDKIASLFSSQPIVKVQANKDELLNSVINTSILHLNTHAGIDEKTGKPWLALYDTLVSFEEISRMNHSPNLVFLDACKTNDGQLQKGEGIESISRAFFHTGSKSVIAAQWNANEKASNDIALSFFKELKKGQNKSTALRHAKLNYLANHQLSETIPYFWASFSLIGDISPIEISSNFNYFWVALIGTGILLIVFLLIRRNSY